MRTTLDLDANLVNALLARHQGMSKTRAIEAAIRHYLAATATLRLRQLAGSLDVEDVSSEQRALDRH